MQSKMFALFIQHSASETLLMGVSMHISSAKHATMFAVLVCTLKLLGLFIVIGILLGRYNRLQRAARASLQNSCIIYKTLRQDKHGLGIVVTYVCISVEIEY